MIKPQIRKIEHIDKYAHYLLIYVVLYIELLFH